MMKQGTVDIMEEETSESNDGRLNKSRWAGDQCRKSLRAYGKSHWVEIQLN